MIFAILITVTYSQCASEIFCQGDLLHTVQTLKIFDDGKTFVDMWTSQEDTIILQAWNDLEDKSVQDVTDFVDTYFGPVGQEQINVIPIDYTENPPYLNIITNEDLIEWAKEINTIWLQLSRKFKEDAERNTTIIQVPNPFFVPGGRFREFYYWDSLWVVDGLLASDMIESAVNMQQNFVYLIEKFGYIPNGARIYYLGRTQPPVLTQITNNIAERLNMNEQAQNLIANSFSSLEKEFEFFYKWRSIRACLIFQQVYCDVMLYHYDSDIYYPRPESYNEDFVIGGTNTSIYHEITSGAESGWDFSSRWFTNQKDLNTIDTSDIIAIDLNVFMIQNMQILAKFAKLLKLTKKQLFYETLAKNTQEIILEKFYNEKTNQWNDYNYRTKQFNENYYASNYYPLLITNNVDNSIIEGLSTLINNYPGGLPTSIINSEQQWDLPNSWPPINQLIIKGLLENNQNALALQLAQNFINNAYCSFQNSKNFYGTGYMFEKYDATTVGQQGGGGEYEVQIGFGWTNGVTIWIFEQFGESIVIPNC